jgi:hypothetical protein
MKKLVLLFALVSSYSLAENIHVYKSAFCGCCTEWMKLAEQHGHEVTHEHPEDLDAIKREFGVPVRAGSCHTAVIGDYFFEGHVPFDAIERFLAELPEDIIGLSVPGMPQFSPGMAPEGEKIRGFNVVAIHEDGSMSLWQRY